MALLGLAQERWGQQELGGGALLAGSSLGVILRRKVISSGSP